MDPGCRRPGPARTMAAAAACAGRASGAARADDPVHASCLACRSDLRGAAPGGDSDRRWWSVFPGPSGSRLGFPRSPRGPRYPSATVRMPDATAVARGSQRGYPRTAGRAVDSWITATRFAVVGDVRRAPRRGWSGRTGGAANRSTEALMAPAASALEAATPVAASVTAFADAAHPSSFARTFATASVRDAWNRASSSTRPSRAERRRADLRRKSGRTFTGSPALVHTDQ